MGVPGTFCNDCPDGIWTGDWDGLTTFEEGEYMRGLDAVAEAGVCCMKSLMGPLEELSSSAVRTRGVVSEDFDAA